MKRSRFSEEQIIGILRKEHAAGLTAAEQCRKHGFSDVTFYKWRSKYGGMEVSEAKRLKALEGRTPSSSCWQGRCWTSRHCARCWEKLLTPGSRRNAVNWAISNKGYTQRKACGLVGIDPRVYRYR